MMIFWDLAICFFTLDRIAKVIAIAHLAMGERAVAWAGVLEWRLTRNYGIALGFLSDQPVLIMVLPILAIVAGWFVLSRYHVTEFTRFASALVVGGFLGNMLDRLTSGYVLDMVFFPWMPWYICNLADIFICFGVALLAFSLLLRPGDWISTEGKPHETNHAERTR